MGGPGGASGGVVGGWATVQWMMRLQAAAFGGTLWCIRWCCQGRGSRAKHGGGSRGEKVEQQIMGGSWAAAFRDNAVVRRAVLSGERRRCDG